MQFIHSANGDGSKTAKIIKKVILTTITNGKIIKQIKLSLILPISLEALMDGFAPNLAQP